MDSAVQCSLPAEWAPQDGVLVTWPHAHGDWGRDLASAERAWAELAAAISLRETVLVVCRDTDHIPRIRAAIGDAGGDDRRVRPYVAPSNDAWARDHGPLAVRCGRRIRLLDFRFDGWGGAYPADADDRVATRLHAAGAFGATPMDTLDLVLEGGAIDVDGTGGLLAVERCVLDPARNPGLTRAAMEDALAARLGVNRFYWLKHGWLAGDDTGGHIDNLARFSDMKTIIHAISEETDAHAEPLKQLETELAALRDADGRPFRLVPLPLPSPVRAADGRRLPASYINFLIINGAVLMPAYGADQDAEAYARLQTCFPDRQVVPIDARPMVQQNGSVHCAALQLPEGTLPRPSGADADAHSSRKRSVRSRSASARSR